MACAWVDSESAQVDALKVGLRGVQTDLDNQSASLDMAEDTLVTITNRLVSAETNLRLVQEENAALQHLVQSQGSDIHNLQ